jgi:hypothetical protein
MMLCVLYTCCYCAYCAAATATVSASAVIATVVTSDRRSGGSLSDSIVNLNAMSLRLATRDSLILQHAIHSDVCFAYNTVSIVTTQ